MRKREGGDIKKISELFSVYAKRFKAPEKTVIKAFVEVIKDVFGVDISEQQCSYSPGTKTLSLKNNGPVRSEILMRKKEILNHLKGRLGEKSSPQEIV